VKRAVVLAGGLGTRLRPYTTVLPKPLMPVGDRPVLDIVVRQLHHHGFERVTIATGYLAELIEAYFGDGHGYGVHIDYFREQEPLGTVGSLALIDDLDDDFIFMNGDVLTDIDYSGFLGRHTASDASATIATQLRKVQISLGVLRFEHGNGDATRVTDYVEKPTIENEVSMGIYCFSPSVLEHIDRGERLDFPDLILRLIEQGRVVRAWRSEDYWLDIGRHDDYEQAMDEFERMRDRLIPHD
jgi:NDP-sugar pyrophosphorylase family protein